ncbi:hypothetical protein D3C78_1159010 [compost metagenome]
MADRLLQHDARVGPGQAGDGQVGGDRREQLRRGGQVVDASAIAGAAQALGQAAELGALRGVHGEVVEALGEALPGVGGEVGAGDLRPAVALGQRLVGLAAQRAAGQGEDAQIGGQSPLAVQVIECRQQLVQGQIAGAAEHQHVAGKNG